MPRPIADAARSAWAQGARVALAPELALCGYPPEDLLLRPAFMRASERALEGLAATLADCAGLHLVVGHPWDGVAVARRACRRMEVRGDGTRRS